MNMGIRSVKFGSFRSALPKRVMTNRDMKMSYTSDEWIVQRIGHLPALSSRRR